MSELSPQADLMARSSRPYQPARRDLPQGLPFEQYLYNWQNFIQRQQEIQVKLFEMSVTIRRRGRGLTLSDQCGHFGVRPETNGIWLDYDPELDGDIYPINIVGPALATNQNACLQSNSKTEVASANQSARNKQVAMRWQRVNDYFDRVGWNSNKGETDRALLFDGVQCDGTWWVESYKTKKGTQTVSEIQEKRLGLSIYQCQECQIEGGIYESEGVEEGLNEQPCPQCGNGVPTITKSLASFAAQETDVPQYEINHRLWSFYNLTLDVYGAKINGIQGAKWLQVQTLADRMELETDYPGLTFAGPQRWAYPLRCDYALANGSYDYLNYTYTRSITREFDRFEKRVISLNEEAYSNYRFPSAYEFINTKGERVFSAKEGQTIPEAWDKLHGFCPSGLKFVWIDERLIDIVDPREEEVDFRKSFSDVHWRRDSGSYLSSPNYPVVAIQDAITLQNTQNINITARNANDSVYFDSKVFKKADLGNEYIGSDNAHLLPDRNLSNSIIKLPVPQPSPYLQQNLDFLWSIKDTVTNVTPALRGEAQRGETLGAVRQQLEQSYGGLTSVLKSFASCKVNVFLQKARMAKECWSVEDFQRVASMFGEIWGEEDIQAMIEVDFETDLTVTYKEGTEMPQSGFDRELKFAQGINTLLPFLQAGVVIPPDKFARILEKIDEHAGFDFDLTGLEVGDMLAQKRYIELNTVCLPYADVAADQVEMMRGNVLAIDEMGMPITELDILTEQIFHEAQLKFNPFEDLGLQMAYFVEQTQVEMGKADTNFVFLEMLTTVCGFIQQAQNQMNMEAMAADPERIAAEEDAARAAEGEEKTAEREDQHRAEDREAASGEQALGLLTTMLGQEHEMEKLAMGGAVQKEVAKAKPQPKAKAKSK